MTDIPLSHGLAFEDLYDNDGLARIDALFIEYLGEKDPELRDKLKSARGAPDSLERKNGSDLMVALSTHLENFLGDMFSIQAELAEMSARHLELNTITTCKRDFVQRIAAKAHTAEDAEGFDGKALAAELTELFGGEFDQLTFAKNVVPWLEDKEANADKLDLASRYAAWALYTAEGRERHKDDVIFRLWRKTDYYGLVPHSDTVVGGIPMMVKPDDEEHYLRDGFFLTDPGMDLVRAVDQANYCIICHERGRDYCCVGLPDKDTGGFKDSPLGVSLIGCPLEMRISEMHKAKIDGHNLAAFAINCIDNPLVVVTGHRICNECMKACIFQKQEPVDIPQVETRITKDILALPWGFEIYSLLTRWNPLNFRQPLPKPKTDYKILIVGAGPAGVTVAHYLMNEGHTVVAVDGLKIEPLPPEISGVTEKGERVPFKPIRDISELYESLDDRVMAGFGGVAEYGITVRWDKNFLKVLRLLVERRRLFTMFGGVRFGSSITAESAFEVGFDHIALCAGAGKPTFLSVPNGLARGVRQASDFLMGLQLTGAANKRSITNLQIRLPVVVIGGGLTATDAATEALGYYVRQVEKFLDRYEVLAAEKGKEAVLSLYSEEEKIIADEFLTHARALRGEREKAAAEGRKPKFLDLLNQWGGSTIAYRRRMIDSPAYRLNHDEIIKTLEQGVRFAELLAPAEVEVDEYGHAKALSLTPQHMVEGRPKPSGEPDITMPARTILVAAGTQPNTTLAREHPGFAEMDGKYYQAYDEDGNPVKPEWSAKPRVAYALMKLHDDGHSMTFYGDLHPSFAGNVVGAMASARAGYQTINRMLEKIEPSPVSADELVANLHRDLHPTVKEAIRLTPNIVEVVIHAPLPARTFHPGQFYRLMNYENHAKRVDGTSLVMEGIALTGAWVDREKGLVSLIVLEMGGSTNLCIHLEPGEPVILMGPTGSPTETPSGETVLLVGGGLGNAVLFSIGQALREAGSRVLYFGGYKQVADRYHVENILKAGDVVVWCCDEEPGFEPTRPQDKAIVANIVEAMVAYGEGKLGETEIFLNEVDRMIVIGSDVMMNAVCKSRHAVLKDHLKEHIGIVSVNAPMQCMMKEICAQCLQEHKDPESGEKSVVFTCFNQDQDIDRVDFECLRQRLLQNGVQEKLTSQWITHCLAQLNV